MTAASGMLWTQPSHAADALPYTQRTHSYNAFSTFAIGDTRTVGMGGATVGLGDAFLSGTSNPAGLAMTMSVGDTNITRDSINDGNTQNYGAPISPGTSLGAALSFYPWTFGIGEIPIGWEGANYNLPSTGAQGFAGQQAELSAESHEYRLIGARTFFENKLSLGMSVNMGLGEEEISAPGLGLDDDRHAVALGGTFATMVQLPQRLLLGASYTTSMHYAIDTSRASPEFPGFFQSLDTPQRLEFGLGWIPNRYFRGDLQISYVGTTPNASLIANDNISVGASSTWQPKLGVAYIFMDYKKYQGTLFGGSYYEASRIDLANSRYHKTVGLEFKLWIFTAGTGIDIADQYKNSFYSIGIDAGIVLQILHLMPVLNQPDHEGLLPDPFRSTDEGLARPLVKDWKAEGPQFDIGEVVKDFPNHVKQESERIEGKPVQP
jgi:hypothetical protein